MTWVVVILVGLTALDLVACGGLLVVTWVLYRRDRRLAAAGGNPVPPAATGQFVFVAALGLSGLLGLYCVAALLIDW